MTAPMTARQQIAWSRYRARLNREQEYAAMPMRPAEVDRLSYERVMRGEVDQDGTWTQPGRLTSAEGWDRGLASERAQSLMPSQTEVLDRELAAERAESQGALPEWLGRVPPSSSHDQYVDNGGWVFDAFAGEAPAQRARTLKGHRAALEQHQKQLHAIQAAEAKAGLPDKIADTRREVEILRAEKQRLIDEAQPVGRIERYELKQHLAPRAPSEFAREPLTPLGRIEQHELKQYPAPSEWVRREIQPLGSIERRELARERLAEFAPLHMSERDPLLQAVDASPAAAAPKVILVK